MNEWRHFRNDLVISVVAEIRRANTGAVRTLDTCHHPRRPSLLSAGIAGYTTWAVAHGNMGHLESLLFGFSRFFEIS